MNKIELLAPAGNLEILKTAIDNGADAVYIGGENFSARAFADNFNNDQIIEAINYAHIKGSKVYVTINTMAHDDEIKDKECPYCDELFKYEDKEYGGIAYYGIFYHEEHLI